MSDATSTAASVIASNSSLTAQPLEVAASASVVLLILMVGTLANSASLAVTCRHGVQSKLHWIFVGNLALADLALALLTPGTWYLYVWTSTSPACPAAVWTEAAVHAAQSISVSAVVAVTIDRASLVFRPIKYRLSHRRATPLLLSASIWLACAALQTPKLHFREQSRLLHRIYSVVEFAAALTILVGCNFTVCQQIERSRRLKCLRRHSGFSAAPLNRKGSGSALLPAQEPGGTRRNTLCSIQQLHHPNHQHHHRPMQTRDTRLSMQSIQRLSLDGSSRRYVRQRDSEEVINEILTRQHRRALRTLLMLVLLFLACRLPRTVLALVDWAGILTADVYQRCNFYLELLVHLNSVLDPFAYVFCGNRLCQTRVRDCWRLFRGSCSELVGRATATCSSRVRCCCCTNKPIDDASQFDF